MSRRSLEKSNSFHSPIRMAEVLAAFSFATDLGTGKSMGHALRACYLGMKIATALRLSMLEQAELYYSFLLMHSGCTALSLIMAPVIKGNELAAIGDITLLDDTNKLQMLGWLRRNVSPDQALPTRILNLIRALLYFGDKGDLRGVCEVAARVAQRLDMPQGVQTAVQHYLERWDGKGSYALRGNQIPLNARILHLALKIEAYTAAYGRNEAESMVRNQQGKIFDPQLIDVFLSLAKNNKLWEILVKEDIRDIVLELEPDSPYRYIDEPQLDKVALAAADMVDLKSPLTVSHSRETAKYAVAIARRMDLSQADIDCIRRAALVRDLGHIALPAHILNNQVQLSEVDKEKLRLHPYYTERILSRVPALKSVAMLAGMHHEHLDGSGYYRGLSRDEIPISARILVLAGDFQEALFKQSISNTIDPSAVLRTMQADVGKKFCPECFAALAEELRVPVPESHPRHELPANLTAREIEVLEQVARGHTNHQVAQTLVISERTVAHHLEHIYSKIGVSNRAAAVFFAMEHELIG